jgi:hypothetical protein
MQMIFAKKFGPKSPDFEGFFFSSAIAVFRQAVCQNVAGFYIFILFSLTSSKIWLILFVDDHECGYITQSGKKKNKNLVLLSCCFSSQEQEVLI